MKYPRAYVPVMIVGVVAAAFFSQSTSSNAATVVPAATAPTKWCDTPTPAEDYWNNGDYQYYCSSDATSRSEMYWDRVYPTTRPPEYTATAGVYSNDNSASTLILTNGGAGSAVAVGHSTVMSGASDNGSVALSAYDSSTITGIASGGATVAVGADTGSSVYADGSEQSQILVTAQGNSVAVLKATGASTIEGDGDGLVTGNSVVHAIATDGSTVLLNVADRSRAVLSVNDGSYLSARLEGSAVAAQVDLGARATVDAHGSAVKLGAAGPANVTVGAENGASVTAIADSADISARVDGNVEALVAALGTGSIASLDARGGSADDNAAQVIVYAADGADAAVSADTVVGDVISATASGQGSRSYVSVDATTGAARTITVIAVEGGTAYVIGETFGCFGGRTSVVSQYGSCTSNGNETVITDLDGKSTTYTDLKAPTDVTSPVQPQAPVSKRPATAASTSQSAAAETETTSPTSQSRAGETKRDLPKDVAPSRAEPTSAAAPEATHDENKTASAPIRDEAAGDSDGTSARETSESKGTADSTDAADSENTSVSDKAGIEPITTDG
ncbi:hypothetical protein ACNHUS_06925 [Actinomycetes bacterium M1A6_2h]